MVRTFADEVSSVGELSDRLYRPGPRVTLVRSDRAANVTVHAAIHDAVRQALR